MGANECKVKVLDSDPLPMGRSTRVFLRAQFVLHVFSHLCDSVRRWFMDASGVLVAVLCAWEVAVKWQCSYRSAFPLQGPSCPAAHRSPCTGAGAGVLSEGQNSDVSAKYQSERIFNCSFLSWK